MTQRFISSHEIATLFSQHHAWAERVANGEDAGDHGRVMITDSKVEQFNVQDLNLSCVLFSRCDLSGSRFENCKLSQSDFYDCDLFQISFISCDLYKSEFNGSDYTRSTFLTCDMRRVESFRTCFEHATFADCDLAGCTPTISEAQKSGA